MLNILLPPVRNVYIMGWSILMEAKIMRGKKLIYLIALIQLCIILSLFLWLYHPGQIIQTGFLHAIWISISTQNFIYCKQKEASSFIVTMKIILYLYGTPRPLTSLHMSWQLRPFSPPDIKHLKIVFKDPERFVVFWDNLGT